MHLIKTNDLNYSTFGMTNKRSGKVEITFGLIESVCQYIKADSLAALITGEKWIYEADKSVSCDCQCSVCKFNCGFPQVSQDQIQN